MNRRLAAAWIRRRRRMQGIGHTPIGRDADVRPVRCKDQDIHTLRVRLKVSVGAFGCSSLTVATAVKIVGVSEPPSNSSAPSVAPIAKLALSPAPSIRP